MSRTQTRVPEAARTLAIALALATLFCAPLFTHWANWGIEDWDQHAFYHEAARVSLLTYGQVPQWNPYACGGTDLLANPQSRALSPTFPLILLFGTVAGLKLETILGAILGAIGFHALGRHLGLDRVSAWLGPIVYFLGPAYAVPASTGMTWVFSTAYIPWVVLACVRGLDRWTSILLAGAALALMYLGGGAYPVPITLAFLGLFAALSIPEQGLRKPALGVAAVVLLMLGLGAAKFFPSIDFQREFPRAIDEPSGLSVQAIGFGLFSRDQRLEVFEARFPETHLDRPDRLLRGATVGLDDVGMYIGPVVAALFVVGLIASGRSLWKLAALATVFVWLSLGDRPGLSLFAALHRLPVYDAFRYPERFRLIWLLVLCVFAGCGLRWLRERIAARFGERAGLATALGVVAIVTVDLLVVTWPIYRVAFPIAPMDGTHARADFRQIRQSPGYDAHGFTEEPGLYASWSGHYPALLANEGVVDCYETAIVPRRAVPSDDPAYRGEVHLDGGEGSVTTAAWTPNRIRFTLDVMRPATLVVNQNYYPSWRAADGRPVRSRDGLIAVDVAPGDTTIELRYGRGSFVLGSIVSALSWSIAAGLLIRSRIRNRPPT